MWDLQIGLIWHCQHLKLLVQQNYVIVNHYMDSQDAGSSFLTGIVSALLSTILESNLCRLALENGFFEAGIVTP